MLTECEVVVVGAGAAGIAAGRRLAAAGIGVLLLEARARLGGRAWTVGASSAGPLDLGCGWLHSAERNPWRNIAEDQGRRIDRTLPPWDRSPIPVAGHRPDETGFVEAQEAFDARLAEGAEKGADRPASAFLDAADPWNPLIDAVSTYYSGAELGRVSARDLHRYRDSGVNWRIPDGYGTAIAAHGAGLPVRFDCRVSRIDHGGRRLRVETSLGPVAADAAILTLPASLLAAERIAFSPPLPDKTEAAAGLPLGLADKLFLRLAEAEAFEPDSRAFGRTDRRDTASYHFRPFGRPVIEAYFGGPLAAGLEAEGEAAFADFALGELAGLFGGEFRRRVAPLPLHLWGRDPFALGSYSFALPGLADNRRRLAEPVGDRLFFAGEATSRHDYSTAHGAYRSGLAAADLAIAARRRLPAERDPFRAFFPRARPGQAR